MSGSNVSKSVSPDSTIDLRAAHLLMCRIREFEETALRKSNEGVLHGSLHLYVGMEAIAAGVFPYIRSGDWFASTHRGHGHTLACGVPPTTMFAELYGRSEGMAGGKAGSMHMADLARGHLGGTGIVGASIHLAAGAALTCQLRQPGSVAVAFFGDGAANRGSFHEGLNMAALWRLPVVFVCENNAFGQWTRHEAASSVPTVAERGAAYGIPGVRADGNDVEAVAAATAPAFERARQGQGPSLLEFVSYRLRDHSGGRDQRRYRDRNEIEQWRQHDPITLNRHKLVERGLASDAELDQIEQSARTEIADAAESALTLAEPNPLDAITDVAGAEDD
jgi:TPP-dependent pyruvate/acetoin dehydrogenase alpha subunit